MHVAVVVALLGSLRNGRASDLQVGRIDCVTRSDFAGAVMAIVCLVFVVLAIRSCGGTKETEKLRPFRSPHAS